ncbi:MAG: S8 family serine peptidase [Hyphomicrobium sp.]
MTEDAMRRIAVVALFLSSLIGTAHAQSRDKPTVPNAPTQPDRGGSSVGGLPDAVTVIDILRRIPRFPPRGGLSIDENAPRPPDIRIPLPQSGGDRDDDAPLPRPRVVTIAPNAPFAARPSPRPAGAGPAIVGAIGPQARAREVLVTLAAGSDANTVFDIAQDFGLDGQTAYASNLLGVRVARFRISDTRSIADVLQQLATDSRVDIAQPNNAFVSSQGAAKPLPVPQYAPGKLRLGEAHRIAQGKRVKVAVIDTALDAKHPALDGAIAASFDALGETKGEAEAHGTAIAAIVGARKDFVGVAPASEILSARAFAKAASGPAQSHTLALLKALDWSVSQGARVVNMSFAGPEDMLLGRAIDAAVARGVVIIAAAGNGGPEAKPAYPAAFKSVIGVTATDASDAAFAQANRGDYIAVAAPGVDIIAAAPNGAYDISSGTSLAAAHVSGVAALMLEKNPKLTPKDIRDRLQSTARAPGKAADIGAGVVDAESALRAK